MGATVSHGLSATTPDNTSYEIRPSHWNDTHAVTFAQNWTASGNTTQSTGGSGDGMVISGAGLASVGVSNNSIIISVPAGAPSPVNFSAGTTSGNLGSVVFSNSNGVSFGLNGSTITGSVVRSKTYSLYGAQTLTGAQNSASAVLSSLGFSFQGKISGAFNSDTNLWISHDPRYSWDVTGNTIAGGGQSSSANQSSMGFRFDGKISGAYNTDNRLWVSHDASNSYRVAGNTVAGGGNSTSANISSLGFYFSGEASGAFNTDTSLAISVPASLSLYAVSNTTQSSSGAVARSAFSVHGAGVASVGISNGSLVVSVPSGGGAAFSAGISGGNTSGDTGTVSNRIVFAGGNNVTVSGSTNAGGMSVTISGANAGGAQTGISGVGASDTTYSSGTVIWSGQANVTVGSSVNGASQYVRLSAYAPVVSNAIQSVGSATGSGTNTSRFAADDHVHAGVFSMGVTNAGNTSGDTRVDVGRFVLQGGNNVTLSQITAANALNTIVISGANAGGAQTGISGVGVSDTTYSSGTVIWSAQANVTLNSSVNGASQYVRISVAAPGGGGGNVKGWNPYANAVWALGNWHTADLHFAPMILPVDVHLDRVVHPFFYTQATNSTLTVTISLSQGIYTKNVSTLSLLHSTSFTLSINGSGTASSAQNSGVRNVSYPWTTTLTAGDYYVGNWGRSTTAGANASMSAVRMSQVNTAYSGYIGVANAASQQSWQGLGVYSNSFSTAMPDSIGISELQGTGSTHIRPPIFYYLSGSA